ncbi:hypothetical protein HDU67_005737 [Dinochytrium kinnereticum]|nr:hypothetical protein HDU67_005737 [Dinochytrium kinnereticum]
MGGPEAIGQGHGQGGDSQEEVIRWSDSEDEISPAPTLKSPVKPTPQPTSNGTPGPKKATIDPPALESHLSQYELEREARIRQNRELLMSLDMVDTSITGDAASASAKAKRHYNKRKRREEAAAAEASRLSRRLRGEKPEAIRFGKSKRYKLGNADNSDMDSDEDYDKSIAKQFITELQREPIVVAAPFTLASVKLTIWNLGQVLDDVDRRPLFWSQRGCRYRHQYPIGFHATKTQFGRDWIMTIEDGKEDGPVFKVESNDGHVFTGSSPTRPWTDICIQLYGKQSKTRVSGPFQFGFTDPFLQAILSSLDPLHGEDAEPSLPTTSKPSDTVLPIRGVRFGERKRGRPKRSTDPHARWTEQALEIGALQIVTDGVKVEKEGVKENLKRGVEEGGGRPKRAAVVKGEMEAEKRRQSMPVRTPVKKTEATPQIPRSAPPKQKTKNLKLPPPPVDPVEEIVDCICDTPDLDDGTLMVSCDHCLVWYHSRCVEDVDVGKKKKKKKKRVAVVAVAELKEEDEWICPRCS